MVDGYTGGVLAGAKYAYEDVDAYNQTKAGHLASDETYVTFGQGIDSSVLRSHNKQRIYGVGQRNATGTVPLQYSGTMTVNGTMTNAYWLLGLLGANIDTGSGPYTHTYSETDTLPSFTMVRPIKFRDTETHETFFGCVANQIVLTAAVNEPVKFSLTCPYRFDTLTESSSAQATESFNIFTFAGGVIDVNGQVVAAVQTLELTILNTIEMVYGVGSRFAQGLVAKQREYNFRLTTAIKDYVLLKKFYDGSTGLTADETSSGEMATMTLTFTNENADSIVFNFTKVHFNENTLPQSAAEVVKDDVAGWAEGLTNVVYTNDEQTAPVQATNIP